MNSKRKYDLVTEFLIPTRVVVAKDVDNAEVLLEEHPRQAILSEFLPLTKIHKGGYIVLDFGREIQGGADITVQTAPENTDMRIVFGESVSEALSTLAVNNATNQHAIRDAIVKVTNWQHFRTWNTGFRFLKLEAVSDDISLSGVQAAFEHRDLEVRGSFKCNDEELNRIWEVGKYTVFLNMQEYVWDGIKRDRLVWIGDMHPEVSTISSVWGADVQVVRDSLDLIRDYTVKDDWVDTIPSYNMWWIRLHYDLYMEWGDLAYLKEQQDFAFNTLERFVSLLGYDANIGSVENHFVDWSSHTTIYEDAGFVAMMTMGMTYGAKVCRILGNDTLAEKCDKCADGLRKYHGIFKENKQVSAMLSLTDIEDSYMVSRDILKVDGAKGMSTFWGYYVLLALAKTGDYDTVIKLIKEYWGAMLKLGATTFWEDFDIEWTKNAAPIDEVVPEGKHDVHKEDGKFCYRNFRHSLCHGWASGPTAYMSKVVLGIKPLEPGYSKVKIEPHLDGLEWAEGTYPTPHGDIYVKHTKVNGEIKTEVKLPNGIELV